MQGVWKNSARDAAIVSDVSCRQRLKHGFVAVPSDPENSENVIKIFS
jgi:hypothetical protein